MIILWYTAKGTDINYKVPRHGEGEREIGDGEEVDEW